MGNRYHLHRFRRSFRQPALRLFLVLLVLFDTLRLLSIASAQTAASQYNPPPTTKRIYIASQHWNTARVLRAHWNPALLSLVQDLGPENVFVSIYESGSYDDTKDALRELDARLEQLHISRNITLDETSHKDEVTRQPSDNGWLRIPKGQIGEGQMALRRIPYLAKLRNRVLEPLQVLAAKGRHFDTILFLNDVVFTTQDVLTLLHTNDGSYAAACSLDFSRYPYYYDTFALRDSRGQETASQIWPYFRSHESRRAVEQLLPVPVASCWNGMVAMPAEPFLSSEEKEGLRFRGTPDSLAGEHLEASECCLIHADNPLSNQMGVYLNPNVRVGYNGTAYDAAHMPMSPWSLYALIWYNRVLRWTTTPWFKELAVQSRLHSWRKKGERNEERGDFCLVSEMQILHEKGWRHV